MSRVAILGIGAIGSVLTKYLQAEGRHQLFYFNRSARNEIILDSPEGKKLLTTQLSISNDISDPIDYLLICLKEYHYKEAMQDLAILMAYARCTVVFRNGLNLTKNLPPSPSEILETIIDCPVEKKGNAMYHQLRTPRIVLEDSPLSIGFSHLFEGTKIQFEYVSDFRTEQWKKLIESASLGGVLCMAKQDCSVFENEEYLNMYQGLLQECIAVARADKAQIPENFFQEMLIKRKAYPKTKGSSMLSDLLNGRPIELNAKNKVIEVLAKKYAIETPVNTKICLELETYNSNILTSS